MMHDDQDRARRLGERLIARRERDGLALAQVARESGVSAGTIKRFETFARQSAATTRFRYEPWGMVYLEYWLEGGLPHHVRVVHDLQRMLERDESLRSDDIRDLIDRFQADYDAVRSQRGGDRRSS